MLNRIDIVEEMDRISTWILNNCDTIATAKFDCERAENKADRLQDIITNEFKEEGVTKAKIIAAADPRVLQANDEVRPLRLEQLKLSTRQQAAIIRLDALKSILMADLAVLKHTTPYNA